jgi:chaperonin cofactor prefoldin
MSLLKANGVQFGQSGTATNNLTLSVPSSPNGTIKLARGNSGATTADVVNVDSSGNVGVGTSSPSGKLHVSGGANPQIVFDDAASRTYGIGVTSGAMSFYDVTGAGERLRIEANGRVGIGTTSPNTSVKLHVETATGHPAFFVQSGASQTGLAGIVIQKQDNNNTASQTYAVFNFNAGNSGGGGIQGNGATGVQFFSSSDIRLKENISGLESQLEKIALLKPSRFDLIEGQKNCVGLIAQEVEEIYPDAVGEGANGYKTIGGISIMETRLIKAIQELKAKNDILEAKVTALENK